MNARKIVSIIWRLTESLCVALFTFCLISSKFSEAVTIPCTLKNGQPGKCTSVNECKGTNFSIVRDVDLVYCNLERKILCCESSETDTAVFLNSKQRETKLFDSSFELQNHHFYSNKLQITKLNHENVINEIVRKKRNVRRNGRINRNPDIYEGAPINSYYDDEEVDQSQEFYNLFNRHYNGYLEENQFVPPGLAKKKLKGGEKTTERSYSNYPTISSNRGQGFKYPFRPNNNYNDNNGNLYEEYPQYVLQKPTRKPVKNNERPIYPNDFQWSTTKNVWSQEGTTVRNEYSGHASNLNSNFNNHHNSGFQGNKPGHDQGGHNKFSISQLKCQEYSNAITQNITGLPLTIDPNPVVIPVRKCVQAQQLIVGGENTSIGEFPHMAAIGFRDWKKQGIAWNCGGTLISDQFVLTAAHCTSTSFGRPVKVRLGEYNLMKNDDGAYPVDYGIVEIITYPEYKPPSKYHDIALLRLSRKVKFLKHIRPACLYSDVALQTTKAIATGWGRVYYDGSVSEVLQKVVLDIVDKRTCNNVYKVNVKTEVLSRGIVDSQLCAGDLRGGKDTCQGDSGGPLSITNTKCIHHIIGITSFGKSCALPNSTGVYTKVSSYIPWIENIVWPQQ